MIFSHSIPGRLRGPGLFLAGSTEKLKWNRYNVATLAKRKFKGGDSFCVAFYLNGERRYMNLGLNYTKSDAAEGGSCSVGFFNRRWCSRWSRHGLGLDWWNPKATPTAKRKFGSRWPMICANVL